VVGASMAGGSAPPAGAAAQSDLPDTKTQCGGVAARNAFFNQRLRNMEAIQRSSIHRSLATPSSHMAMARCKASSVSDPAQALSLIRSLIQPELNEKIRDVMKEYIHDYFAPAIKNIKDNLGEENVSGRLLEEICISSIDHAKAMYAVKSEINCSDEKPKKKVIKRKPVAMEQELNGVAASGMNGGGGGSAKKKSCPKPARLNTDLILIAKTGKPVRREGPKWETARFTTDTLFILGSKANKALGFGQTRGRLYMKHPELFKYSGDQEDKEWLAKNQLMSTTGGKAYLMVLEDILELANSPDYASHPRQMPNELVGFTVRPFSDVETLHNIRATCRRQASQISSEQDEVCNCQLHHIFLLYLK
jgi:deoxynucleotidyltransferase terminal-interacting protein 1